MTILVNGLPLVQIELKRRGLEMKEAFNQVQRYQKHSYWSGHGLLHFVQLFVISNGVNTKYYANARRQSPKQTFYWAQEDNTTIRELTPFADAFLNRQHLGTMIGKYIVLNQTDKIQMVLRPYQYYATEAIVERVKNPPATDANGYIWHTTGSGKTLTSFKAAQIMTGLPDVHKVVFCVDRKDPDYQTIKEFNSFSKGSVDGTNDTKTPFDQFWTSSWAECEPTGMDRPGNRPYPWHATIQSFSTSISTIAFWMRMCDAIFPGLLCVAVGGHCVCARLGGFSWQLRKRDNHSDFHTDKVGCDDGHSLVGRSTEWR